MRGSNAVSGPATVWPSRPHGSYSGAADILNTQLRKLSFVLTAEALVTEDSALSLLNLCIESLDSLFPIYFL